MNTETPTAEPSKIPPPPKSRETAQARSERLDREERVRVAREQAGKDTVASEKKPAKAKAPAS